MAITFREAARQFLTTADSVEVEDAIEALFMAADAAGRAAFRDTVKNSLLAVANLDNDRIDQRIADLEAL